MRKRSQRNSLLCLSLLLIVLIALDLFVKHLADIYLSPAGTSLPFIEGILNFTSAHNTGAAFSMFSDAGWVLIIVRAATSAAILFFSIRFNDSLYPFLRIVLTVILAGALGNLFDQLFLGYVRDMFEFAFIRFAVFNVADVYVTLATGLLLIHVLFSARGKAFADNIFQKAKTGE